MKMRKKRLIDRTLYRKILATMPVACVDAVVIYRGRFLLLKRRNRPAKDQWWFPGGRILKGETFTAAVKRKLSEEIGLEHFLRTPKFLVVDETTFPDSALGPPIQTVNIAYVVELTRLPKKLKLDSQTKEARWFSGIDNSWHPHVKKVLRLAGFRASMF